MKRGVIIVIGLIVVILLTVLAINLFKNDDSSINQNNTNIDNNTIFDSLGKQELLDKLVEICKTSKIEIENANDCIESNTNKLILNAECETLRESWDYSNNEEKQETLNYLSEFCTTTNGIIELANECVSGNTETYDC